MHLEGHSDADLLLELRNALDEVVRVYPEVKRRRAAWRRVVDGMREFERRFPPEPSAVNP
jgi:hypothetical protein